MFTLVTALVVLGFHWVVETKAIKMLFKTENCASGNLTVWDLAVFNNTFLLLILFLGGLFM